METLKQLKALEDNLSKDTPVIALTANAVAGAKEEYIAQGFADYLSKPVQGSTLPMAFPTGSACWDLEGIAA